MANMTTIEILTGIKNWVMGKVTAITSLIPSEATSTNKLADKAFVNSSIATATTTFRGTYNLVSDLSLTTSATEQQIATALAAKMSALSITPTNNDYAFVQIPTADATPTEIARVDKYKYNGTSWAFEYSLNNSSFTAAQWATINSGLTSGDKTKLDALPTNSELTNLLNGKEAVANKVTSITENSTDTQYGSAKAVWTLVNSWLSGAMSWTAAQMKQARANLGFGNGDIDITPTAGSHNLVESGGVQNELALGAVYDVSAKNPTAGPNNDGKFTLEYILNQNNVNTLIPTAVRKGGMSIKFVCSSDNKYVQFRYMLDDATTNSKFMNVANWQGVDDTPTTGSKNLVESGGVANDFNILKNRAFGEKQIYSHSVTQGVGGNRTTTKHTLVLKKGVYNLSFTNGILGSFSIYAFSDDTNYSSLGFYSDRDTPVVEVPFDTKYIALYYQDVAALTTGEISFNFVWSNNLEFRLDTISPKAEGAYNKTLCTLESLTFNEGYYKNDGTIENTSALKCVKISAKAANIITFYNSISQEDGSVKLIFWDDNNNILRTESQGAIPKDNCNLSIKYLIEGTCYIGINIKTSVISEDEFYYRLGNYNTNDKEYKEYIDLTFSSYSISKKVAPFCLITNSQGTKITGSMAQTISVTFNKPLYNKTISLGIRVPYSTQDLTDITINGKYINRSGDTNKTVSGKYYKMQGDTYQRVNIYCDSNGKSSFNIRIGNDCNFEIWVSNKAIVNDEMPLTPVCFIYDGGHWNGTIEYNGTTYTIWALHRLFGIPYNIATEPNSWDDPSSSEYPLQEVLDDINNGFAGKMLRSGNSTNYWVDDDSIVVPRLNSALNAIEATAKSTVFAQNMFDKQTLRQCKGAGIELVRGYSTDVDEGFFGSKYKDSGLIYIPGNSVAKTMPEHLIKFPVIYWAHGIGQPHGTEAQKYSSYYSDQDGVGTLAMFNRIASEMASGNLGVFKMEEFIQYIKTN